MNLNFIEYPRPIPLEAYQESIDRMIKRIINQQGVVSIYQVGNISDPGISDIDLLVIFEDEIDCLFNPFEGLSKLERYLFSHHLFGMAKTHFYKSLNIFPFHNYKIIWGEDLTVEKSNVANEEISIIKKQIAVEYLIKMYISISIEIAYKTIKVRSLLMHTNALLDDLEILNIDSGKLFSLVKTIVTWRKNWFENKIDKKTLNMWVTNFHSELSKILEKVLRENKVYFPQWFNLKISNNISIIQSNELGYIHRGIKPPFHVKKFGKKYFNLWHKFNRFIFKVPICSDNIPLILQRRHQLIYEMLDYNSKHLNNFVPTAYALDIFRNQNLEEKHEFKLNLGSIILDKLRIEFLKNAFDKIGYRNSLLDLGCAQKPYENIYSKYVKFFLGCDVPYSLHSLDRIEILADGLALPFKKFSFDIVVCTEVMEHIPEPDIFLKEIIRVLKPGGYLILTTPFLTPIHEGPYDFYRYTKYGIKFLLGKVGFTILQIKSFSELFGVVIFFFIKMQLKFWSLLSKITKLKIIYTIYNPFVFMFIYLPQLVYIALIKMSDSIPLIKKILNKLSYSPIGYGILAKK